MDEIVVYTHDELADAVIDTTIGVIYFGADIQLEAPITIPPGRASLVFDGTHNNVRHRFTDMNSNLIFQTLAVRVTSSVALIFRHMDITGHNFYGVPCIYDSFTSGVSVTYIDITYVGPQLVHNLSGLTHFENCDITIHASSVSQGSEAGEVSRVEFSGENIIRHDASDDPSKAVFWFHYSPASFTLFPDAKLTVQTTNYFMFNAVALSQVPVAYDIQQGASFTLISRKGISHDTLHWASSFTVGANASFRYIQEEPNDTVPSLYISGEFTAGEGSSVYMQADFDNAYPLIAFASGLNIPMTVNQPKSFVLYNKAMPPIAINSLLISRNYSIAAEQLNHWIDAEAFPEAGTFDDIAQNRWHNGDWSAFTVSGNVSMSNTSAISSGLEIIQPPLSNFTFQSARVISAGNLFIQPDTLIDNGRPITGLTEPGANIIISFTVEGVPYTSGIISAREDGLFEFDPMMSIPAGTVVEIGVNTPFLVKYIERTVLPEGEISIVSSPEYIKFKTPPISTNPVLLRRLDPEAPVKIEDTRPYPSQWSLSASVSGPLTAASGEVLEDAVVFKDEEGVLYTMSDTPLIVRTGEAATGTVDVTWPETEGILVRVTQPIRSGVEYSTRLIWLLES